MKIEINSRVHGRVTAIVSPEDAERVSRHTWCCVNTGSRTLYARAKVNGRGVYLHRFVLSPPKNMVIDHINQNGLDCRRENMRICTTRQNARNRQLQRNNSSGFMGVCRDGNRWRAQLSHLGEIRHLGSFGSPREAALAYDAAVIATCGEFATTNAGMGLL